MDWSNLTFLIGSGVAILMKQFWFRDDTAARDKAIPIIVFVSNLMARLAQELGAPGAPVEAGAVEQQMQLAFLSGIFGWGVWQMAGTAAVDSLMSYGLHRGKRWMDNMRGWKPAKKKK
jgi:hypothetical protein